MGRKKQFLTTDEEKQSFIKDYKEHGSAMKLAAKWNMTTPTAIRYLRSLDQPVRGRGRPKKQKPTIIESVPSPVFNAFDAVEEIFHRLNGGEDE